MNESSPSAPRICFTAVPRRGSRSLRRGTRRSECSRRSASRRGASTVEFAFVAPLVFLFLLALFQFAGLLMRQNVLTAAAREGGRVASLPSTVSSDTVVAVVEDRLRCGGVNPGFVSVNVQPAALGDAVTGDELRVSVSAPMHKMCWISPIELPNANLTAEATYQRE